MCKGLGVGTWGHHGVFEARTDPGRRPVSPAAKEAPRGLSRQQGRGFGREPTRCRRSSPHRQTPRLLGPLPPGLSFQGETKRPRAEGPLPGRCPPGKILCGRLHEGLRDRGPGCPASFQTTPRAPSVLPARPDRRAREAKVMSTVFCVSLCPAALLKV